MLQNQLKKVVVSLIIKKFVTRTDMQPINLKFLSDIVNYITLPFKESIKEMMPTFKQSVSALGQPFRRFLSGIEFNSDQSPFLNCKKCETTILKVHKYCSNCGQINE